jgi:histidinol-phosphate/aromatic aminotransferase/cobyric acid decarboxylase-like protein
MKLLFLLGSHATVGAIGFALGIYLLPILTAPPAPAATEVDAVAAQALYRAEFRRDLAGSDALHWGEGQVSIGRSSISLMGRLAPGPDYKLYLSPTFVEDEAQFNAAKAQMVRVGDVRTFENFIVDLPDTVDPEDYDTVVVWCEAFGEFITAARYR